MKLCVAQTRPFTGDIEKNIAAHKKLIELALAGGADMIIFPELSVTGYEPTLAGELATTPDDSRFDDFQHISDTRRITIGVGVPLRSEAGLWISMVLFQPRQDRHIYSKKYLHADEEPYFVSGQSSVDLLGAQNEVALAICYELSVPQHAADASGKGAGIYVASVAKSVAGMSKATERLSEIARTYSMVVLMANCIGLSDGMECGGKSSVWNTRGELLGQLNDAEEGILIFDTDTQEVHETYMQSAGRRSPA
jgi:predicted amidohydrolase